MPEVRFRGCRTRGDASAASDTAPYAAADHRDSVVRVQQLEGWPLRGIVLSVDTCCIADVAALAATAGAYMEHLVAEEQPYNLLGLRGGASVVIIPRQKQRGGEVPPVHIASAESFGLGQYTSREAFSAATEASYAALMASFTVSEERLVHSLDALRRACAGDR